MSRHGTPGAPTEGNGPIARDQRNADPDSAKKTFVSIGELPRNELRSDHSTAERIRVGMIYMDVFGKRSAIEYLRSLGIKEEISTRIIDGRCRKSDEEQLLRIEKALNWRG